MVKILKLNSNFKVLVYIFKQVALEQELRSKMVGDPWYKTRWLSMAELRYYN